MHANRFFFVFLICIVLLFSLLPLTGCQKDDVPAVQITLAADGKTDYVIVCADDASSAIVDATRTFWSTLNKKTDADFLIYTADRYRTEGMPAAIFVGVVDDVGAQLRRTLHDEEYVICIQNGNLYLVGGSDAATVAAVERFIETYLGKNLNTLTLDGDFELRYTKSYTIRQLSIDGEPLSSYRIVYDANLCYARARAEELCDLLSKIAGYTLPIVPDMQSPTAHEILVGETNRPESGAVIASFAQPNRCFAATVQNGKAVLAFQGVRSGEAVLDAVNAWLGDFDGDVCDLARADFDLAGDLTAIDAQAIPRSAGTDLRVMHSNVLGTLGEKENGYTDEQRAELLADTYLLYYPDVLTLNEMNPGANRTMTNALIRLLSPYYTFVDATYLGLYPDVAGQDGRTTARQYSFPVAYRKDAGLRVLDAGFNYLADMLPYHGCAWTVLETAEGNRFLAASVHLSENVDDNKKASTRWVENVMEIVNVARDRFGKLPLVLNGDWYFAQTGTYKVAYNYMIAQNLADVSETADAKHSVGCGTFHTIGMEQRNRIEEDLIFITPEWFRVLSHKVLVDFYTTNGSDHYPVLADLQFTAVADKTTIPDAPEEDPAQAFAAPFLPEANGALLLEVTDLSATARNAETGAVYTQAFGNGNFYTFDASEVQMYSLAVGGAANTVTYGGKTNLLLGADAKYTVTYRATLSAVASGGLRISYDSNNNSVGFYAHLNGTMACLAWGAYTAPGYSGYQNYTDEMKRNGAVYGADGYAKFDLEIDGYVISGYVNDILLFREDIRTPSNAAATSNIAKNYMSGTLSLVWHEYTNANVAVGTKSTAIKDLKIYAGLLHQETYSPLT